MKVPLKIALEHKKMTECTSLQLFTLSFYHVIFIVYLYINVKISDIIVIVFIFSYL